MNYLLDTNICVYVVKRQPPQVLHKFQTLAAGTVGISSISVAELQFGVARSRNPGQNQQALDLVLTSLVVIPFDHAAAVIYGDLRTHLDRRGTPIGQFDTLIAAHALSLNITLVTNNLREFARVPNLQTENWV
jgi:tRNA(fMet)-specific endonuclease VapC